MKNPWKFECPKGWEVLQPWGDGFALQKGALRAIVDCPSHEDMAEAKRAFIGERYAYSVWPPSDRYVNIHSYCLHLWACMEGDGRILPEFSEILPKVGLSI